MLLATCYEGWQLDALRSQQGSSVQLTVDATGAVMASAAADTASQGGNNELAMFSVLLGVDSDSVAPPVGA